MKMEITIVRLFMLLTAAGFVYVFILFFVNLEAPDGLKNAFLLMAAIIPLLGIAFTLVSSPSSIERKFAFAIFYDNHSDRIITGTDNWNAYAARYMSMFLNLKDSDLSINKSVDEQMGSKGFNFIEYGIVWAFTQTFSVDWNIKTRLSTMPPGGARVSQFQGTSTEKDKY